MSTYDTWASVARSDSMVQLPILMSATQKEASCRGRHAEEAWLFKGVKVSEIGYSFSGGGGFQHSGPPFPGFIFLPDAMHKRAKPIRLR